MNLSEGPLNVFSKPRPLYRTIQVGEYAQLAPLGTGKQTLELNSIQWGIDIISGKSLTTILFPDGKTEIVPGEERVPGIEGNVRVVEARGDGSASFPASGVSITGPTKGRALNGHHLSLAVGDYHVGDDTVKIESGCAYTFLYVPFSGKIRAFLMKNTDNGQPVGSGMSKN